jgi:carboxylesterase type B
MCRILIFFFVAGLWLAAQAIPIVDIPFGVSYHGIIEPSGVESFRNIPFGQSTAGEGRFAPPRPILHFRHAIINATEPGPVCPQQMVPVPALPIFSNVTNISEDCLNLRITRPANTTSSSNLPVMVYIYGGEVYMLYSFT